MQAFRTRFRGAPGFTSRSQALACRRHRLHPSGSLAVPFSLACGCSRSTSTSPMRALLARSRTPNSRLILPLRTSTDVRMRSNILHARRPQHEKPARSSARQYTTGGRGRVNATIQREGFSYPDHASAVPHRRKRTRHAQHHES